MTQLKSGAAAPFQGVTPNATTLGPALIAKSYKQAHTPAKAKNILSPNSTGRNVQANRNIVYRKIRPTKTDGIAT